MYPCKKRELIQDTSESDITSILPRSTIANKESLIIHVARERPSHRIFLQSLASFVPQAYRTHPKPRNATEMYTCERKCVREEEQEGTVSYIGAEGGGGHILGYEERGEGSTLHPRSAPFKKTVEPQSPNASTSKVDLRRVTTPKKHPQVHIVISTSPSLLLHRRKAGEVSRLLQSRGRDRNKTRDACRIATTHYSHLANPRSRNGRQPSPPPCDQPKTSLEHLITSAQKLQKLLT